MKITIRAAGLIKSGPERELIDDYVKRAKLLGRGLGISDISESAVDIRGAKSRLIETQTILSTTAPSDILIILDERGQDLSSRDIAKKIDQWRNMGGANVTIAIGGADGFEPAALPQGVQKWRLGRQTWPHKMVRVMIAEQVYRALSILARTPYHRD
jgi:23S rRNA (pseudouridine1915-N3)-methyltransferase